MCGQSCNSMVRAVKIQDTMGWNERLSLNVNGGCALPHTPPKDIQRTSRVLPAQGQHLMLAHEDRLGTLPAIEDVGVVSLDHEVVVLVEAQHVPHADVDAAGRAPDQQHVAVLLHLDTRV